MTKLQVYRTDQMNVWPVDPAAFPRMANQLDFYLKSDVDALLPTMQQPEPTVSTVGVGTSVRLTAFYPADIFGNVPADGWTVSAIYQPKPNYEITHPNWNRMVVSEKDFAVNRTSAHE